MSESKHTQNILTKQRSWSPDIHRDLEWHKLKSKQQRRYNNQLRRSKSSIDSGANDVTDAIDVTDDDVKELKGCFDLGFGFDKLDDLDPKIVSVFPALELYAAVNRQYNNSGRLLSRSSSLLSSDSCSSSSSVASIVDPSDDPQKVKTKLKQWAQLVRCSILETSSRTANNKSIEE